MAEFGENTVVATHANIYFSFALGDVSSGNLESGGRSPPKARRKGRFIRHVPVPLRLAKPLTVIEND